MADYMHVYVVFVHGYTVITSQLTSCVKSCAHDEYAHYINSDIAQWLDSRTYNNQLPLNKACNFVFIIPELQSEFHAFRDKIPCTPDCSLFPLLALLDFWNKNVRPSAGTTTAMYEKQYRKLNVSEVDTLCQWVYDTREACQMGRKIGDCQDLHLSDNASPLPQASDKQPVTQSPPEQYVSSLMHAIT